MRQRSEMASKAVVSVSKLLGEMAYTNISKPWASTLKNVRVKPASER
jgi:hypothetical protein